MENSNDILNELKALSPVIAAIEKNNPFKVPDGYFENLSNDIMLGIGIEYGVNQQDSHLTSAADVPIGYFDSLAQDVLQKIKLLTTEDAVSELKSLSPMLYSIQHENIFEVPEGYFEGLSEDVLNKVMPKQARVITMQRRTSIIFKYAVAAVFTGVMALGVFKFTGNADKEMVLPAYVKIGLNDIKDVDQELASISDNEIVKYLEAGGSDVKAAIVANSIDKNELPSQEDYLMDEKALDKYLNSINVNDLNN